MKDGENKKRNINYVICSFRGSNNFLFISTFSLYIFMALLESAYEYYNLNWNLLPIKQKSKIPDISSWKELQSRKISKNEIEEWFGNGHDRNIALVCGEISGVVCLDIDGQEGVDFLKDKEIPLCPTYKSSRGFKYLFKYPEGLKVQTRPSIFPQIDFLSDGHYVLLPPSLHPTGTKYEWENGKSHHDLILPDVCQWLLKEVTIDKQKVTNNLKYANIEAISKAIKPYWKPGQRDTITFALAGMLVKGNWPMAAAQQLISSICQGDEELDKRLHVLKETYNNFHAGKEIQGASGLENVLSTNTLKHIDFLVRTAKRGTPTSPTNVTKLDTIVQTTLDDVKKEFSKWLLINDELVIEIPLAVIIANMYQTIPIWMFMVAPPASAKTEILLSLAHIPWTYFLSKITPQTLVSGFRNKEIKDASLINKMTRENRYIIIMKDFTTILEMRTEQRAEILSQLREIYDGKLDSEYGNAQTVNWEGHMGFLAGVTNKIDAYSQMSSMLGERYINFRPRFPDRIEVAEKSLENAEKRKQMRKQLAVVVNQFISSLTLPPLAEIVISQEDKKTIVSLANLLATMRCGIQRDWYHKNLLVLPEPESPARLAQQFMQLCKSLAVLKGRKEVNGEEMKAIKRITLDSMTSDRLVALRVLTFAIQEETTRSISQKMNFDTRTTKQILEDLYLLKIVDRAIMVEDKEKDDDTKKQIDIRPYTWILKDEWRKKIEQLELF